MTPSSRSWTPCRRPVAPTRTPSATPWPDCGSTAPTAWPARPSTSPPPTPWPMTRSCRCRRPHRTRVCGPLSPARAARRRLASTGSRPPRPAERMTVESRRALGSRYELVDRLGSGAMGEVWRARDRETGADVAAKLLRSEYTQDRDILTRFVQERSILLALDHPNIVRVHDLVVEGDRLAIVMDLLEGGTLGEHLRREGTLAVRDAVLVTCSVLDGLAHAHSQKTLHRDVKPDNVLLAHPSGLAAADVRLS